MSEGLRLTSLALFAVGRAVGHGWEGSPLDKQKLPTPFSAYSRVIAWTSFPVARYAMARVC
jgi:hypothetical protein